MQNHISDNDDLIINEEAIIFPTMENRDLVQQYLSIYQGLQTSNRLKEPLYLILMSYWLHGPSFADRTIEAKKLLPSIEKMKAQDCLYDALRLVRFCWDWQNSSYKQQINYKNRQRTKNARLSRQISIDILRDLEEYCIAVEDYWHPISFDEEEKRLVRNQKYPRQKAIEIVFKKNEKNIVAILKQHGYKDTSLKKFASIFNRYTKLYTKNLKRTRNGYPVERRAPRSAESRERSRQGAKRHLERVKKTKA